MSRFLRLLIAAALLTALVCFVLYPLMSPHHG